MVSVKGALERSALTTRERWAWVIFDWADQAFATVIIGVVLPIYYVEVAGAGLEENLGEVYWAYTLAFSFGIVAVSSPILGAIADHMERSRAFLAAFTVLGVVSTGALVITGEGDLALVTALTILANIGYNGGRLFYNSLLPGITTDDTIDRVSAAGFSLGYAGGTVILLVAIALTFAPETFGLPDAETATGIALFIAACWWAIFAIPLFLYVPEPERDDNDSLDNPVVGGFKRLYTTYTEVRQYREAFLFLLAFWFYTNGVMAIISLAAAYATGIGIGQETVMGAFLLVNVIGIPCAIAFGQLAGYLSTKKALYIGLGVYLVVSMIAIGISEWWHFIILAILVGLVQGGTQALSRSLYGSLLPRHKSGEFFAFFTIVAGFASVLAPLLFGVVGQLTGSTRIAIGSLSVFFVVGAVLLNFVDVDRGRRLAKEATPDEAEDSSAAHYRL